MSTAVNRRIKLRNRPKGVIDDSVFEQVEEAVPEIGSGEFLVKVLCISIDPTNRTWIAPKATYLPPVEIGDVMRALAIGQVVSSENDQFPVGQLLYGLLGWQEYAVFDGDGSQGFLTPLPPEAAYALPLALSLGMTALTAFVGLEDIGKPQPGETVVVSAAAGATGSVAGQIAKIKGARVVGIAGSEEKCSWLVDELGFDVAINRHDPDWRQQLADACPNGVDVDFENVGGKVMEAVFDLLNLRARVVLCGLISAYNHESTSSGSKAPLDILLVRRVHLEGFIVIDHFHRFPEVTAQLLEWFGDGRLKVRETVIEGLERAPEALQMLFTGDNIGKLVVKVAEPDLARDLAATSERRG